MVRGRCKMIGYSRTSTSDQRLSIGAQQETLSRIAGERGCDLVRTFTEHESGGDCERQGLAKAIKHARRVGAVLVVAKVDRLARDAQFLMKLFDGNVPILFGDLPEVDGSAASRLMVQTLANIAEFERRRMGERMKDWHRERRAQGIEPCYGDNLTQAARVQGSVNSAKASRARAVDEMSDVAEIATQKRSEGLTLQQIADHLNDEGFTTRTGGAWHPVQVQRVLSRAAR